MEKNILTCVGEERRGRKETKKSLAQVLERIWDIGNGWSWERRWGIRAWLEGCHLTPSQQA